jgi:hypothetical protein
VSSLWHKALQISSLSPMCAPVSVSGMRVLVQEFGLRLDFFSKRRLSRVELQWDCDVHVVYGVILVISRRTRSSIMSVVVGMCCI